MNTPHTKFQPSEPFSDPIQAQNYYQCKHCDTFFIPKKRFVQKYCSESCRVMAYRNRKVSEKQNLTGFATRNRFSNDQKPMDEQQNLTSTPKNNNILEELKSYLDDRDANLLKELEKFLKQQEYHMWISAIAPFIAEPVRKGLMNLLNGNPSPQDANQFLGQIAPMIKELPKDLQLQILKLSKDFWDQNASGKGTQQQAAMPDPGSINKIL